MGHIVDKFRLKAHNKYSLMKNLLLLTFNKVFIIGGYYNGNRTAVAIALATVYIEYYHAYFDVH